MSGSRRSPAGVVGIIVNPLAGKDVRRLGSAAGHVSDAAKMAMVRRVVAGAVEAGASRLLLNLDSHRLCERALAESGVSVPIELFDGAVSGTRDDTVATARWMRSAGAGAVVALGGDGTARDVAIGWKSVPLIAIAAGTNNVYPVAVEATAAGTAAALVATGAIPASAVASVSKCVNVCFAGQPELALVDVAVIDNAMVGARAVHHDHSLRLVIAAIASPVTTGLSGIAGRLHPVDRFAPGGVAVWLGPGGRPVRVPLSPGSFTTVFVRDVQPLQFGESVSCDGPGVVAFDGERHLMLRPTESMSASIGLDGPLFIDVPRTMYLAADQRLFDVPASNAISGGTTSVTNQPSAFAQTPGGI